MEYHVYSPQEKLGQYIRLYWSLEGDKPHAPIKERVFPDGCIELIFHYGDLFKKYNNDGFVVQPRNFIHGQLKKFIEIEATGKIGIFSVRFHPHGLRPFLDFDVDKLTDKVTDIKDIWLEDGIQLENDICITKTNAERIKIIETFLSDRIKYNKGDIVPSSVKLIEDKFGMISIDEVAEIAHVGRRHFERKFSESVGINPKLFARIIRFNYVLKLIEKKEWNNLTQLAQEGGFYDQAHFIKDFKDFTGLNPRSYFAEDLELVKFFNLK